MKHALLLMPRGNALLLMSALLVSAAGSAHNRLWYGEPHDPSESVPPSSDSLRAQSGMDLQSLLRC
jgi:hypothetical protein